MTTAWRVVRNSLLAIAMGPVLVDSAIAQQPASAPPATGVRTEIWLAASSWPTLGELRPVAGGSFDDFGYGLGASAHWPVKRFANRELLLGIEGAVTVTDSDVPVALDDLLARHGYLAISGKVVMGDSSGLTFDAGIAYHLVEIVEFENDYALGVEFENWEERAAGAYLGVTWEPGAGRPQKRRALTLGFRVHFVDFGTVRDQDTFAVPALGPNAGELLGPYHVRIGYRWR